MTNTEIHSSLATGSRTAAEVAAHLNISESDAQSALDEMVASGEAVPAGWNGKLTGYLPFGPDKEATWRDGVVISVHDKGTRSMFRGN